MYFLFNGSGLSSLESSVHACQCYGIARTKTVMSSLLSGTMISIGDGFTHVQKSQAHVSVWRMLDAITNYNTEKEKEEAHILGLETQ